MRLNQTGRYAEVGNGHLDPRIRAGHRTSERGTIGVMIARFVWLLALGSMTLFGCTPEQAKNPAVVRDSGVQSDARADGGETPEGVCAANPGSTSCSDDTEVTCGPGGQVVSMRNCVSLGLVCAEDLGCVACVPGTRSCEGNVPLTCRTDGTGFDSGTECDLAAGESCDSETGVCADLCTQAANRKSYEGCEYWPTITANPTLNDEFHFAVAIANPQDLAANVTITRAGSVVDSRSVAAGDIEVIELPWIDALKTPGTQDIRTGVITWSSNRVDGGAFKLTSSVPVIVYQFNPLEYRLTHDCTVEDPVTDGQCFSVTNDASLLLPEHALTGNYLVMSRGTNYIKQRTYDGSILIANDDGPAVPGFISIVGVGDSPVEVAVTTTAYTTASLNGSIASASPGSTLQLNLAPGDVVQLLTRAEETCAEWQSETFDNADCGFPCRIEQDACVTGPSYDFTGTTIVASGPVQVISGHPCDFVPFNRLACDHLEETLLPLETWGTDLLVAAAVPVESEPTVFRVLSGDDDNAVTFDPAVHDPVTLSRGQYIEFESSGAFRVHGTGSLLVGEFLVGQDYEGTGSIGAEEFGDPSLAFVTPAEQYRTDYTVLTPSTFNVNYINIIAPTGVEVLLDGVAATGFEPIGASGYSVARPTIGGGVHRLSASAPFGIMVYGFAPYSSYMYPGGLDLVDINVPF